MPRDSAETADGPAILVVGCGLIGQQYCRCLCRIGARIVAVCDPDPGRRLAAAAIHGGEEYADHRDAIAAADPDLVCVCTPTKGHYPIVLDAAAAGCHVFLEKPMAETLDQAEAMASAMEKAGRSLGFGLKMRYEAVFREAQRRIEAGEIGRSGEVAITYNQNLPPPDRAWYLEEGVLLGSMPHPFDLANWWLGLDPEWLWAETGNRLGFGGEDRALVVLGYADDKRAILQMAYQASFPEVAARDDMVFQIVGESGYLQGDRSGALVSVTDAGTKREVIPPVDAFEAELRDFLGAISANQSPPVDGASGLLIQRMIDAAMRSASTGARVEIA